MEHSPFDGMVSTSFAIYLEYVNKKLGLTDLSKVGGLSLSSVGLVEEDKLECVLDSRSINSKSEVGWLSPRSWSLSTICTLRTKSKDATTFS